VKALGVPEKAGNGSGNSKVRRVHVLTAGFTSPNGRAFLMPLILHRQALADAGIAIHIFEESKPALIDCDILVLDSKFHSGRWASDSEGVLAELAAFKERISRIILADILDSAGFDHVRQLPFVTLYCKAQLLHDRNAYLHRFYGYRAYSDYYHRIFGVEDEQPVWSEPISDPVELKKMTVGWNSSLADYSWAGPYRMAAYNWAKAQGLLRFPVALHPVAAGRDKSLSCRIGTAYLRRSVAFQREEMARRLKTRVDTRKVSRRRYLRELQQSKIAISPFGLGEITLRDFEIFLSGALLLKPDMSGIETWPDLYRDRETMVAHRWDLADLDEKIEGILSNETERRDIAAAGQANYRKYLSGPDAGALFADHFAAIVEKCDAAAG
jgi:hypothetical protein